MSKPGSFPWCTLAASAALGALGYLRPDLEQAAASLRELPQLIEREGQRHQELEHKFEIVLTRSASRTRVVNALADGRMTLLEAAAQFRALNEYPPDWRTPHLQTDEYRSEEEQLCRQVIDHAARELEQTDPARARRLTAALEVELAEYLQQARGVRLAY
jgi:hypothetical protein